MRGGKDLSWLHHWWVLQQEGIRGVKTPEDRTSDQMTSSQVIGVPRFWQSPRKRVGTDVKCPWTVPGCSDHPEEPRVMWKLNGKARVEISGGVTGTTVGRQGLPSPLRVWEGKAPLWQGQASGPRVTSSRGLLALTGYHNCVYRDRGSHSVPPAGASSSKPTVSAVRRNPDWSKKEQKWVRLRGNFTETSRERIP